MHLVSLTLSRLGRLTVLVALLLLVVLVSAAAAATSDTIDDLTNTAQLIAWIGGVLLPFVVALLAKARATSALKSLIALVSAGLLALGLYLADVSGAKSWQGALSVFVIALVSAAASRVTVTGGADDALNKATGELGVG